jgi:hypothetical protein
MVPQERCVASSSLAFAHARGVGQVPTKGHTDGTGRLSSAGKPPEIFHKVLTARVAGGWYTPAQYVKELEPSECAVLAG